MATITKDRQLLLNELNAFAEVVNAKDFSKDLRDLVLDYFQTEGGQNGNHENLLVNLQRLHLLLDVIEEYQEV